MKIASISSPSPWPRRSAAATAHAQGIPVIDIANLIQTIQQVMNDITEIENQVEQIRQLQSQVASINGIRNLGTVFNSPALSNYVPANAFTALNAVGRSGYGGPDAHCQALRDAGMVYNCMDLTGAARTAARQRSRSRINRRGCCRMRCSAASGRLAQINSLMGQINATDDQKAVLEIQARIGAENAMLAHEMSQVQMLHGMADSEERIARSRDRERQYEMLDRTGKISDYLR